MTRALRLLLACALLWLAAGAPGQGTLEHRAVVVMIAQARAKAQKAVQRRAEPASASAPILHTFERLPAPVGAPLVLIEDRYLRFCSLLS